MMKQKEIALFAAGCFWHIEDVFLKTTGVIKTSVGYTGGHTKNPIYEEVSSGKTGHAEAVRVTFYPAKISYEKLLELFWKIHDPTSLNKQGADRGTNYRSTIFYKNEKQRKIAEKSKERFQKNIKKPIVTEITKASAFYPAEEYHQKYLQKNKNSFCNI